MFAYLRDRHGEYVTVNAPPVSDAILEALREAGVETNSCRLAIGNEFAMPQQSVPLGIALALIPPVSGG
jgi:molybdopterin converting factor small subunit